MVKRECVRLGLLQEVDDVAILVCALRQALLLGLALERGLPAALRRRSLRQRRRANSSKSALLASPIETAE